MSDTQNEVQTTDTDFSLADLADLDISEVQEIRFESLPAGIYAFKIVNATLDEGTNQENEKRFFVEFKLEVVECKAVVKKGVTKEELVGKQHSEKMYIVPEKAAEGIGRIRAAIADMRLPNEGKFNDVLASTVGETFTGKIAEQTDKNDRSRVYARLKLDPVKPAK